MKTNVDAKKLGMTKKTWSPHHQTEDDEDY